MTEKSAWRQVVRALSAWEAEVFRRTAARRSPALDVVLAALTRAADYSLLWVAVGGGMMATGRPSGAFSDPAPGTGVRCPRPRWRETLTAAREGEERAG